MFLITYQELMEATGYTTPAEVAAHLERNNIRFHRGKRGRPYTWSSEFKRDLIPRCQPWIDEPQKQVIEI